MYKFKMYCYPLLDNNTYSEHAIDCEFKFDYNKFTNRYLEHFLWHTLKDEEYNKFYKVHIEVLDENDSYYTDLNYVVYLEQNECIVVEDIAKFRNIKIGDIVRHFKWEYMSDDLRDKNIFTYKVLGFGIHSETRENMVIYQELYSPFETCILPYYKFMNEIDHEEYPNTKQVFRFYKVK